MFQRKTSDSNHLNKIKRKKMNRSFWILIWVVSFALFAIAFDAPAGKQILAVLDSLKIKTSHSRFFKHLEEKGYSIDYVVVNEKANFSTFGEWNYDHLILFAPTAKDLAGIQPQEVLDFIDAGRNVLITGESNLGEPIRTIASDCNIEFDDSGSYVIDHLHHDASDAKGDHTLLLVDNIPHIPRIFEEKIKQPVLFKGIGQDIEEDSPLLLSLLTGYSSSYSSTLDERVEQPHVIGKETSLVTALQARNNARVIFSGSLELFSDRFFSFQATRRGNSKTESTGNEQFVFKTLEWLLKEKGVLRIVKVEHHRVGESGPPDVYTINEELEYTLYAEEWNGKKWVPFNVKDIQLEFSMIDPHIRTILTNDGKNGKYTTRFKIPDRYGVFTFRVDYVRKGYTFLSSIVRTPVRPYRHNQYERFIESAYPYYASAFSMLGGLFLFSWVFLYHREKTRR